MAVRLLLSCVSGEFGAYRDSLRRALTRPNVEVKILDGLALGLEQVELKRAMIVRTAEVRRIIGD